MQSVYLVTIYLCLCVWRFENKSLQEELETIRVNASATQLELGEKLAQAVTEITLLHHTLRGLTNQLHAALNEEVTYRNYLTQSDFTTFFPTCTILMCSKEVYIWKICY